MEQPIAKYIDADLLRKEIEFAKSVYDNPNRVVHGVADAFRQDGRAAMCDDILKKIDSLQQEQPKPSGYDKALLEVKSKVDELYEGTSIGLSEYDSGLYNGIAETCMKLRGFIKSRLSSQEHPDEDFEENVEMEWDSFNKHLVKYDEESEEVVWLNWFSFVDIANYFYELGKNSK